MINLGAWIALYFVPMEYNYLLFFCVLAAFSLAFNDVLSKMQRLVTLIFLRAAREMKRRENATDCFLFLSFASEGASNDRSFPDSG